MLAHALASRRRRPLHGSDCLASGCVHCVLVKVAVHILIWRSCLPLRRATWRLFLRLMHKGQILWVLRELIVDIDNHRADGHLLKLLEALLRRGVTRIPIVVVARLRI